MKSKTLVLLIAIVLLGGSLPLSRALAADESAVLTPTYQVADVGQNVTVTLRVNNVTDLYGYQATIAFNATILEVNDADLSKPGIQVSLGTFLQPDFVQQNSANNSTGTINCVVSQLSPTSAVSGSGDLFTITFHAKAQGLANVQFTDLKLARANGQEIPVTRQDAQINVGNVVPPTATPTATAGAPTATPTATPVTGPTATPIPGQPVIYVVRPGDTLYSIARRFGVTVEAIAHLNQIANPSYIQAGQRLIIPRGPILTPVPPIPPPGPIVYVVQRGDTLYSIARRYGTTVEAIAVTNRIANPSRIYAGQRLVIPGGAPIPGPGPVHVHIVQRGETLYSIARRYGTTYWAIAMLNHLPNPNVIYAGQRLMIP